MLFDIKDKEIAEEKRAEAEKKYLEARRKIEATIDFENQKFLLSLAEMCWDPDFDVDEAKKSIEKADISKFYFNPEDDSPELLLNLAVELLNVKMVKLLLESGADPNSKNYSEKAIFYELIYLDCYEQEEVDRGLEIIKLFLDYGADPCYDDGFEYENLFDSIALSVFKIRPLLEDMELEYLCSFLTLLIIYGGKSDSRIPEIVEEFDKNDVFQYHFEYTAGSFNQSGLIKDRNGKIFAYI